MKKVIGIVLSLMVGLLFGFFGVMNSVFTDAALSDRLVFIAVIIAIYGLLGLLFGFLFSEMHILAAILLAAPGILLLIPFLFSENFLLILLYMALLAAITFAAATLGRHLRVRTRKNR